MSLSNMKGCDCIMKSGLVKHLSDLADRLRINVTQNNYINGLAQDCMHALVGVSKDEA